MEYLQTTILITISFVCKSGAYVFVKDYVVSLGLHSGLTVTCAVKIDECLPTLCHSCYSLVAIGTVTYFPPGPV